MISLILALTLQAQHAAPIQKTPQTVPQQKVLTPAPTEAVEPAPPFLQLQSEQNNIRFRLRVEPASPKPGETVTVILDASTVTAGDSRTSMAHSSSIAGAKIRMALIGTSGNADVRIAAALEDPGSYGASFTSTTAGAYALDIDLFQDSALKSHARFGLAWGMWPIPEAPSATLPRGIQASLGNIARGQSLCAQHCRQDLPWSNAQTHIPALITTAEGFADDNNALVAYAVGPNATTLPILDRVDLTAFLRSLHPDPATLVPHAGTVIGGDFALGEFALERLAEHGVRPVNTAVEAPVFAAFAGDDSDLQRFDYNDRHARESLTGKKKMAYVIVLNKAQGIPIDELVLTIAPEPSYKILSAVARDADAAKAQRYNTDLARVRGLGAFNSTKTFANAPKSVQPWIGKSYLLAAEFATQYYGEERSFTAFDREFENKK